MRSDSATRLSWRVRRGPRRGDPGDAGSVAGASGLSGLAGPCSRKLPTRLTQSPQLVDDLVEPLALDQLHGVEGDIAVPPDLEDRHDVGVVQPRRRLRLAAEALQRLAVAGHVAGQDLEATRRPSETCSAS